MSMDALKVGLMFLIPGVIFFLLVLFNYTELEHEKEPKNWRWFREDKYKWFWELALFRKVAEKSFIIAKIILLITAFILISIGTLGIWVYHAG